MRTTRRELLKWTGGCAVLSLGGRVPQLLADAAAQGGRDKDTILVVLQLSGGNDGLNTVIPYRDDAYRRARPQLAIGADQVLKVDDRIGLHPSCRGLADLLENQSLAIIQGVGYPNPNRSHFESMDIWHTCQRKGGPRTTGWLGRFLDETQAAAAQEVWGVHVGPEKQPLALVAEKVRVPSLAAPDRFQLNDGGNRRFGEAVRELASVTKPAAGDDLVGFLQTSTSSALAASDRIAAALRDARSTVAYPQNALGQKFKTVAQLISAGLGTRVYYLELDGFDTHSQQAAAHAALLQQFSSSLQAFQQQMVQDGHAERVLVLVFSEFGRRVAENASEGTDHGAAAPVFLAGPQVKAGLITEHPSLTDLVDGDLKHQVDFRQIYAAIIERWLGWESASVLGGTFKPVDVLKA